MPENEHVPASRMMTPLRSRTYRRLAFAVRAVLGLALAWLLVTGQVVGFLIVGLFFALSFAYRLREDRLPNAFDLFVALAALLNAFGFAFNLYTRLWPYDEAAHAFTVFSLTLALFFLFYKDQVPERGALATAVFTFGMAAGALWELVEWTAGLVLGARVNSGLDDAMTDLLANGAGALVATFVALAVRSSRRKQPA